jgi:hypothetical protein
MGPYLVAAPTEPPLCSGRYDKGAPDYQSGDQKDLKWRVICDGVRTLIKKESLREENVMLWVDWQARHGTPPAGPPWDPTWWFPVL